MHNDSREQGSIAATTGAATAVLAICVLVLLAALVAGIWTWGRARRKRDELAVVEEGTPQISAVDAIPVISAANAAREKREQYDGPRRVSLRGPPPLQPTTNGDDDDDDRGSYAQSTYLPPRHAPVSCVTQSPSLQPPPQLPRTSTVEALTTIRVVKTGVAPWLDPNARVVSDSFGQRAANAANKISRRVFSRPEGPTGEH
ncbi:hypothetical protein MCUN1_002227 [Malassezia cuniculi]|uniref:Uncharacterized protein n=1 Tax=Malassezia cuniculi TaxID=948313 RepID=A0AAF0ER90_9BASI|nr:hypothetical protein MCUN1_002227 [Malassezia cuniculi]